MDLSDKRLGLTPKRQESMHALGLRTAEDVLTYYPSRYDVLNVKPFDQWQIKEKVAFEGEVVRCPKNFRHGRMTTSSFEVLFGEHILRITIFNRPWISHISLNQKMTIQGIYNGNGRVTAVSYDLKPLSEHDHVTPVYSTKEGITQKTIRGCIEKVLNECENEIQDDVPERFIHAYRLLRRADALRRIHFPSSMQDVQKAERALKYEEFLRFFTAVQLIHNQDSMKAYKQPRIADRNKLNAVISRLPYELTADQRKALEDIITDMGSTRAMYRLIQGDVGCGKTAVAGLGLYAAVTSGCQAALLAPTEILARQHLNSLNSMLAGTSVHIAVLYSGLSEQEKRNILKQTAEGDIDILIGTHSLIQKDVQFRNLGMVVTDEQQRFGVEQRRALKDKGNQVDFLLMSATPIPRTLASAVYGDMDVSTIQTMPAGRIPPVTTLIQENSFRSVLNEVMKILQDGHQLYVICAAVEDNPDYPVRNVQKMAVNLQRLFLNYRVGLLYGAMSSEEKQEVMEQFNRNEVQVLVSTTVVEVGMNVINAIGMIVYDADRFGLSQLHQLRGRIQRGNEQGHCWLLTSSKDPQVIERLNVLVRSNDGFEISYEDLRLRGPGDILGKRQSGLPGFILGNITEDTDIVNTARKDAQVIVNHPDDPDNQKILGSVEEENSRNADYVD